MKSSVQMWAELRNSGRGVHNQSAILLQICADRGVSASAVVTERGPEGGRSMKHRTLLSINSTNQNTKLITYFTRDADT